MKIDLDAIAREAQLIEPRDVWADLPADYRQALSSFAALVLEKAADFIGDEGLSGGQAYQELRSMSAALQSGERG